MTPSISLSIPLDRLAPAAAIGAASGLALAQSVLEIRAPAIEAVVMALLIVGMLGWEFDRVALARGTLLSCATLAFGLPLFVSWTGRLPDPSPNTAFAAVLASLTLAFALERLTGYRWGFPSDAQGDSPNNQGWRFSFAAWTTAGIAAVVSILDHSRFIVAVAILMIVIAFCIEAHVTLRTRSRLSISALDHRLMLTSLGASVFASAVSIAAIVAGDPFGWPIAGIGLTGLLSTTYLAANSQSQSQRIQQSLRHAAIESRIDVLTGLANRRGFDERIREEVARSERYGHPLSLLMIDIDDFKRVNDASGHAAGDEALRTVASQIEKSIRSIDTAARYGGEEFAVILPETAIAGAAVVAERIRGRVAGVVSPHPLTVSIGVAELTRSGEAPFELVNRADAALYRAKVAGKNRLDLSV